MGFWAYKEITLRRFLLFLRQSYFYVNYLLALNAPNPKNANILFTTGTNSTGTKPIAHNPLKITPNAIIIYVLYPDNMLFLFLILDLF